MKQRILITVVPGDDGRGLLESAQQVLASNSFVRHIESLIDCDRVLFFSDHLDLWSMGDSFTRLLRPKSKLLFFDHGSFELYAIPRDVLRLHASPRDEEERLLRDLLISAKRIYREAASDGVLFVLRTVLGHSPDISNRSTGPYLMPNSS